MTSKRLSEVMGKQALARHLKCEHVASVRCVSVDKDSDWATLEAKHPWLCSENLVVKPDQLIKRRGKQGLVYMNKTLTEVKEWIASKLDQQIEIEGIKGQLKKFIVEPYVVHSQEDEYYICIYADKESDNILFHHEGGVNVGNIDEKAVKMSVSLDEEMNTDLIKGTLLTSVPKHKQEMLVPFIQLLFKVFRKDCLTYVEINPLVVTDKIHLVDAAIVLDILAYSDKLQGETLESKNLKFSDAFGRVLLPEEAKVAQMDRSGPGEFKLAVINPKGRIWQMTGGGASSLLMCDAVCDLLGQDHLGNFAQFSGKPVKGTRAEFTRIIVDLMTREKVPEGKLFYIASTVAPVTSGKGGSDIFTQTIDVLKQNKEKLQEHKITIAFQQGVVSNGEGKKQALQQLEKFLGIPIRQYGPKDTAKDILSKYFESDLQKKESKKNDKTIDSIDTYKTPGQHWKPVKTLFTKDTKAFLAGVPPPVVQDTLNFDFLGSRQTPSVAALIQPDSEETEKKFKWGDSVITLPIYKRIDLAVQNHTDVDVLAMFAPPPVAFKGTMFALKNPQIKTILLNVGGMSELQVRQILQLAKKKGVTIIGPGSLKHPMQVGGIKPGCFQFGRMGGNADNVIASKLYRPGSVGLVSRTGGLSNLVIHTIAQHTDGLYQAIAIGGGSYTGTSMIDHVLNYQQNPNVKIIFVLGEVGTTEELDVAMAIKDGQVTKPVIAYCIGTSADLFEQQPTQFGHGGLTFVDANEKAVRKNEALKCVGAVVPDSFDELGQCLSQVYQKLVKEGVLVPKPETDPPNLGTKA